VKKEECNQLSQTFTQEYACLNCWTTGGWNGECEISGDVVETKFQC
jgi:hypothetical protein